MKWYFFLLIPLVSYSIERQDIRNLLKPEIADSNYHNKMMKTSTKPYYVNLDSDDQLENIVIRLVDGHYEFLFYKASKLLSRQKIRAEGGNSKVTRFHVEDIGDGFSTVLIFLKEVRHTSVNKLEKRRVDLITFKREDLRKVFYYEGPLVSFKKESWDSKKMYLRSSVTFEKLPKYKTKVLLVKDEVFSTILKWDAFKKTWY